jgi:hypothetical protein
VHSISILVVLVIIIVVVVVVVVVIVIVIVVVVIPHPNILAHRMTLLALVLDEHVVLPRVGLEDHAPEVPVAESILLQLRLALGLGGPARVAPVDQGVPTTGLGGLQVAKLFTKMSAGWPDDRIHLPEDLSLQPQLLEAVLGQKPHRCEGHATGLYLDLSGL